MPIGKNEMVKLLEATQYRQVTKMTRPGEFYRAGEEYRDDSPSV